VRSRVAAFVPALALALAGGGCTGGSNGSQPQSQPLASTTAPTSTTSSGTPPAQLPFDCAAVSAAQQALNDATFAELTRLGIDRDDPRAFTVVLVVASQEAAEYWHAVEAAATPHLDDATRGELSVVTEYWKGLDAQLDAIELPNSDEAQLQQAASRLQSLTGDDSGRDAARQQQQLQDLLAGTCGTEPAPAPSTTA
jgi:hypothetical protein